MVVLFASTGMSFTAVILTVEVTVLKLSALSFTVKVMERAVVVGLSELFAYFTARSADCHCASVAVFPEEVSASTPAELDEMAMLPMVEPSLVKERTSWPATKFVMVTEALASVVLSRSLTLMEVLMAVAASYHQTQDSPKHQPFRSRETTRKQAANCRCTEMYRPPTQDRK